MRFFSSLLVCCLAFIGLAAAQDSAQAQQAKLLATLAPCATNCLLKAIAASPCGPTDTRCQCTNAEFVSHAEICIVTSCTVEQSLVAKNATQTMCGAPVRDKRVMYNVVSCTLMAISCALVLVRVCYKKLCTTVELGLDDWFIFLALLNCVPSAFINVHLLTRNGLGKDIWTLTPEQIEGFAKGFYAITICYFSEVFLLKLSILFFYLRIFPSKDMKRLLWATIVFDVLFGVSFILIGIFQCTPISANWTAWRGTAEGQCTNQSAIAWANAAVSITMDLWMLAIPMSQLKSLNLHWKKKVGVGLMFFVGTFVTVISIVRLSSLIQFRGSSNLTWDYYGVCLYSTVEITIGIICACMPTLRRILVRIWPRVFDGSLVRRATGAYAAYGKSPKSYNDDSKHNTQSDGSKSKKSGIGSRGSVYWKQQLSPLWRNNEAKEDKVFVDGIQFSALSRSELEQGDDRRLVTPENWHTATTISAGRTRGGRDTPTTLASSVRSTEEAQPFPYSAPDRGRRPEV
ncbi:CFEM domain-containing protein [Apiospora aurea]|uniref:CFEM domain-containing protein n=1 Tax=Apiospora aurea TaxID=335848 RepID=A0ABR1QXH4_9PEZI